MISELEPIAAPKNAAQLINQTSGEFEYFTPLAIVNVARDVMRGIDLDPASSEVANGGIAAKRIFTIKEDAMRQVWTAKSIWMNHPFGIAETPCEPDCRRQETNPRHKHHDFIWHGNAAWVNKLIYEFKEGNFEQGICITYACTSEAWFTPLLHYPQCFLVPRTNYYTPEGKKLSGVTKGSVVTYLGPNVNRFAQRFANLGVVKIPYPNQ